MLMLPSSATGQRKVTVYTGAIQKYSRERRGRYMIRGWLAVGRYDGETVLSILYGCLKFYILKI